MMPVWHKYLAECAVLQYVVRIPKTPRPNPQHLFTRRGRFNTPITATSGLRPYPYPCPRAIQVDLSDVGTLALSLTTLLRVMAHPDLRDKAVVVCLNKADSPVRGGVWEPRRLAMWRRFRNARLSCLYS